jgi:hypothetical protein
MKRNGELTFACKLATAAELGAAVFFWQPASAGIPMVTHNSSNLLLRLKPLKIVMSSQIHYLDSLLAHN